MTELLELVKKRNRVGTPYYTDGGDRTLAKVCTICGAVRLLEEFSRRRSSLDGRRSECKDCEGGRRQGYYARNSKRERKNSRKHRKENSEYYRRYARRHYRENPEYYREYRKENSEAIYLNNERRRARKHSLPYTLTLEQKASIKEHFSNSCALTGDTNNIHFDHVIPISVGHGGTTLENMIPLRGDLNNSKYNRNIFEWFESEKDHYGLSQERFNKAIAYLAEVNDMTVSEYREYVHDCHSSPAY